MYCYYVYGNTYNIREDLKAWGCIWDAKRKEWKTPPMSKDEPMYRQLSSLALAVGGGLTPEKLSKECQKIQDILNDINMDQ